MEEEANGGGCRDGDLLEASGSDGGDELVKLGAGLRVEVERKLVADRGSSRGIGRASNTNKKE